MLINKCVCNFCGKVCEHEEYKIPMFDVVTTYATNSKSKEKYHQITMDEYLESLQN